MNAKIRGIVNNLKKVKPLKNISLAKFTNLCLELDLLEYLPQALKRLGRNNMMKLPEPLLRCSDALLDIRSDKKLTNKKLHAKAQEHFKNNTTLKQIS